MLFQLDSRSQTEAGCMIIHDRPAMGMRADAAKSIRPIQRLTESARYSIPPAMASGSHKFS
jgi:hypothetical protein